MLPGRGTGASPVVPLASGKRGRLRGPLEQFAADQHAADLRSAGADLVQLGIAPQASGRILVDVAVAAEDLDRLTGRPRRFLRRIENRTGCILARGAALVAGLGHRV